LAILLRNILKKKERHCCCQHDGLSVVKLGCGWTLWMVLHDHEWGKQPSSTSAQISVICRG
jgi:hypothetical protein